MFAIVAISSLTIRLYGIEHYAAADELLLVLLATTIITIALVYRLFVV